MIYVWTLGWALWFVRVTQLSLWRGWKPKSPREQSALSTRPTANIKLDAKDQVSFSGWIYLLCVIIHQCLSTVVWFHWEENNWKLTPDIYLWATDILGRVNHKKIQGSMILGCLWNTQSWFYVCIWPKVQRRYLGRHTFTNIYHLINVVWELW